MDQTLFDAWRQKEVLSSLGLIDRIDYPRQAQQAIACSQTWETPTLVLGRTAPSAPNDSGWFVGCMNDAHDHQVADALRVVPLIEVAARLPPLTQFLALPVGTDVVVSSEGRLRARVFIDGDEVKPKEGSYLDALNRQD